MSGLTSQGWLEPKNTLSFVQSKSLQTFNASQRFEVRDEIVDLLGRQVRRHAVLIATATRCVAAETIPQRGCTTVVHVRRAIRDAHEGWHLELFARADVGKLVVGQFGTA
ncbi:MAG TPA: hypothetical protein PK156_25530, partial [Polyangium sp.]|nr:hypothetical protein [Polyangium sp.]